MTAIVWDKAAVVPILKQHGVYFCRVKPKRGLVKEVKTGLNRRELLGNCFGNCLHLVQKYPDMFWYCEGFAAGPTPHAWLSLKENVDVDWAVDITWPWRSKHYKKPVDKLTYFGLKFDARDVVAVLKARKNRGIKSSASMLKHPEDITHLLTR